MHRHALRTALVAVLMGWGVALAAPSTELGEALATAGADADHGWAGAPARHRSGARRAAPAGARLRRGNGGQGRARGGLARWPAPADRDRARYRQGSAGGPGTWRGSASPTARTSRGCAWARAGAVACAAASCSRVRPTCRGRGRATDAWQEYAAQLEGLTLRFAGNDGLAYAMHGHELVADELNWSPVTGGDSMLVEVELAAGLDPRRLALRIPQLSHLDIHPAANEAAIASKIGESDSCERDIVCRSNPTGGFQNAEKAVARMVFTKGGSSYLCTGTLLNNANSPRRHLFWSANHCIAFADRGQHAADLLVLQGHDLQWLDREPGRAHAQRRRLPAPQQQPARHPAAGTQDRAAGRRGVRLAGPRRRSARPAPRSKASTIRPAT